MSNRTMTKQRYSDTIYIIHTKYYSAIKRGDLLLIYTITWLNLQNLTQSESSFADYMLYDFRIGKTNLRWKESE